MEFLTRKLGPLPVWAWGVVGLLGFVAFRYFRSQGQSAQAQNPAPTADQQQQELLAALMGTQAAITSLATQTPPGAGTGTTPNPTGGQSPPPQVGGNFWAWRVLPGGRLVAPEEFFLAPMLPQAGGAGPGGMSPVGQPYPGDLSNVPPWLQGAFPGILGDGGGSAGLPGSTIGGAKGPGGGVLAQGPSSGGGIAPSATSPPAVGVV